MAHAASQLKKKADENLAAAEEEKEKERKRARKRSREVKKKVKDLQREEWSEVIEGSGGIFSLVEPRKPLFCHDAASSLRRTQCYMHMH